MAYEINVLELLMRRETSMVSQKFGKKILLRSILTNPPVILAKAAIHAYLGETSAAAGVTMILQVIYRTRLAIVKDF